MNRAQRRSTRGKEPGVYRTQRLSVMSPAVARAWPVMGQRQREYIADMHRHYEREFAKHCASDPASVAATVHGMIDDAIEADRSEDRAHAASQIACRKGCAACCHVHVTITDNEAALLLLLESEGEAVIDWERVEQQAQCGTLANWASLPYAMRACVFLGEDGACRVYEHRPSACRRHFVVSDPAHCDTQAHPGHAVLNWVSYPAEVIASAAMAVFETASMPVMLVRARQRAGRAK